MIQLLSRFPKPAKAIKMVLPVRGVDVGVGNGRSAMYHHPISHIDTHMGWPVGVRRVIGADEEHQIAGFGVGSGHRGADIFQPDYPQPPIVPAAMIDDPGHIAGTIEESGRVSSAPNVGEVSAPIQNVDFRRNGMSFFTGQHTALHTTSLAGLKPVKP